MKLSTLALIIFISGCSIHTNSDFDTKGHTNTKTGIASIITKDALESYNEKYLAAPEHKAFAQSLSGAWNWKSNRTSLAHAKTSALVGCQKNNTKNEGLYPWEIINADGVWLK